MNLKLYEIVLEFTGFSFSKDIEIYSNKDNYRFEVRELKDVRRTPKGYVIRGANALYRARLRDVEIEYIFTPRTRPSQFILYTNDIEEGIEILKDGAKKILKQKLDEHKREEIMYNNLLEKVDMNYEIKKY